MNVFRPNFLIIGAMKSGTSSLWNFVRQHPEVFMPDQKEIEFFSRGEHWRRGVDWYARHFDDASPRHKAIGEASTGYTKYPLFKGVPARIASTLPDVRFIYLVREPVERMRSHWEHIVRNWGEKRPLDVALLEDSRYLSLSRYATQLDQYLEHFDRDRFLVLTSEDLKEHPASVSERVFRFIGVDPDWEVPNRAEEMMVTAERRRDLRTGTLFKRNPRWRALFIRVPEPPKKMYRRVAALWRPPPRPEVSPEVAAKIRDELRDEVARLRPFMDDDFDGWGIA